ncbi:MAG: hypothetical protein JF607_04590 [Burkholderiales bacterium]|jgi:hypothetical protein|nr:hypothetical protein [Burkholderiales bacterium]
MKIPFALVLLALATGAQAGVSCKIGGADIRVSDSLADFNYSPSGKPGHTGKVSRFRLMTLDGGEGPTSSVELKAVDITTPGDYAVSNESLWRSVIRVQGKQQKVTGGKFKFTRFEMHDSAGRAAGTVEFTTDQTSGSCSFDVEVKGINRDRLGL